MKRYNEITAINSVLDEKARVILAKYGKQLKFHGKGISTRNMRRSIGEVSDALERGQKPRIVITKADGAVIKFIAEAFIIWGAMRFGALEIIRLIQSTPDDLRGILVKLGIYAGITAGTTITILAWAKVMVERKKIEGTVQNEIAMAGAELPKHASGVLNTLDQGEYEEYIQLAKSKIRTEMERVGFRFSNMETIQQVINELSEILVTLHKPGHTEIEAELKRRNLIQGSIFHKTFTIAGPNTMQNITQDDVLKQILEVIHHHSNLQSMKLVTPY